MKALIETIVRYIACGEDYIDVQTTTYFLGLPIAFKSKKYVPPIEDKEMAADIRADGIKPKELAKVLDKIVPNSCGIIVYNNWVHFDTRNTKYRKGM